MSSLMQISGVQFWSAARPIFAIALLVLTGLLLNPGPSWQASSTTIDDLRVAIGQIGLILFPAAGWMIAAGLRDRARSKAALSWPTTTGHILTSTSDIVYAGSGIFLKTPSVTYQYSVAGRVFESDSIQASRAAYFNWGQAKAIAVKYKPGNTVTVFYDPSDPSEAILEVTNDAAWRKIFVGVFLAVLAVALGFLIVRPDASLW